MPNYRQGRNIGARWQSECRRWQCDYRRRTGLGSWMRGIETEREILQGSRIKPAQNPDPASIPLQSVVWDHPCRMIGLAIQSRASVSPTNPGFPTRFRAKVAAVPDIVPLNEFAVTAIARGDRAEAGNGATSRQASGFLLIMRMASWTHQPLPAPACSSSR